MIAREGIWRRAAEGISTALSQPSSCSDRIAAIEEICHELDRIFEKQAG